MDKIGLPAGMTDEKSGGKDQEQIPFRGDKNKHQVAACVHGEGLVISENQRGVQNGVGESLTIEVKNTRDAIAPASEKAEAWLEAFEPSPKASFLVPLAIEEIVLNCIDYGYDDTREHTIMITLTVADQTLTMTVVDDGHEFDPLARSTPDLAAKVEDRPIGGLGIHLLRNLADDMTYERRDGMNRLTLIKRIS